MQDPAFEILFLGENPSWALLNQALLEAPGCPLQVRRVESLGQLFQSLTEGPWHAVAIDVHAWNFRGLHYVEKVRSVYPAFPVLGLYSGSLPEIDAKARTCGASRCFAADRLTAATLYDALASFFAENGSRSILQKTAAMADALADSDRVVLTFSKNQVITHALNNLLCVICANAEILSDKFNVSGPDARPISEIKKAAKSAAALMRHLK
jgi:DNA-binding NtrC family response regulator